MKLSFYKYQGLGNDFVILDGYSDPLPLIDQLGTNDIKLICNRRFGVGADGLILSLPARNDADIRMRIFNVDGSEAEMCGNGIRCLAKFHTAKKNIDMDTSLLIETKAGLIEAYILQNGDIKVDMGSPCFEPSAIPTTLEKDEHGIPQGSINLNGIQTKIYGAGMGNPHMVVYVNDLTKLRLEKIGPELEHSAYFPNATNVHFVSVDDTSNLKMLVWERGSGPTLACGTGACAVAAVSNIIGLVKSQVEITLPGGKLFIEWPDKDKSIFMTGAANLVYKGTIEV